MSKFFLQGSAFVLELTRNDKKALCLLCFISALHILLIFWMMLVFNKVIPFQQPSVNRGSALQVRFLSQPVILPAIISKENTKHSKNTEQQKSKLISTHTETQKLVQQVNQPESHRKQEKTLSPQKSEPAPIKAIEKVQSPRENASKTDHTKTNEVKENVSTVLKTGMSIQQSTHHSSQPNPTQVASAESVEKTNNKNMEFKAINRRLNYPMRARSLGVEGRVRVQFDITRNGTVSNILILSENPAGVFTDSVLKDMARWRYQTTGEVKSQVINIVFKLDGRVVLDN